MKARGVALEWKPAPAEPQAPPAPRAAPPAPALAPGLFDPPVFIAGFAPDLTRLTGLRVSLRPAAAPTQRVSMVAVASIDHGPLRLTLAVDPRILAGMIDGVFGAGRTRTTDPARLLALPATTASWKALARLLARAFEVGMTAAVAGHDRPSPVAEATVGPAEIATRVVATPAGPDVPRQWFAIQVAGEEGLAAITAEPRPQSGPADPGARARLDTAPGTPLPDRAAPVARRPAESPAASSGESAGDTVWRARAARLARALDLSVGVRIAEVRLPLATVLELKPGSILPIARPASLGLTVEGVAIELVDPGSIKPGGDHQ